MSVFKMHQVLSYLVETKKGYEIDVLVNRHFTNTTFNHSESTPDKLVFTFSNDMVVTVTPSLFCDFIINSNFDFIITMFRQIMYKKIDYYFIIGEEQL